MGWVVAAGLVCLRAAWGGVYGLWRVWKKVVVMFSLDLRSLALFRMAIGLIVLLDLLDRMRFLREHYTDAGKHPAVCLTVCSHGHGVRAQRCDAEEAGCELLATYAIFIV